METLIWQLVDRFLPAEGEWDQTRGFRPDLITRVDDLVMVGDRALLWSPGEDSYEPYIPPGRHPVYVGSVECGDPETDREWRAASLLFVALAEPERLADAQWYQGDYADFRPVRDYVLLCDKQAWALSNDPVRGSAVDAFIGDVEGPATAGRLGSPREWPSRVVDDESGVNVLALPIMEQALIDVLGGDDEELLAVMYLSYSFG